jgi:hypothetical protein
MGPHIRCLCVVLILATLPAARANDQQPVANTSGAYLLRVERLLFDQDVCVLVQRDGQYHIERLRPYGISVFEGKEGKLRNGDLASLENLLTKDKLFQLRQNDIGEPLAANNMDRLFVSILRPNQWQNLEFNDAEARKPYADFLNPLVKLLDDLQKEKAKELPEESGRNNCMPPKQVRLQPRSVEKIPAAQTPVPVDNHPYILRAFIRSFDSSKIENSCIIVKDTGVYHVRRSQRRGRKETTTSVLDGTLSAEARNSLRVVIDADPLRKWPTENPPPAHLQAATITNLSIPRMDHVQEINVWRYNYVVTLNLGFGSREETGMSDHGTKVIKSLDDWIKINFPTKEGVPITNPDNPQCLPEL